MAWEFRAEVWVGDNNWMRCKYIDGIESVGGVD